MQTLRLKKILVVCISLVLMCAFSLPQTALATGVTVTIATGTVKCSSFGGAGVEFDPWVYTNDGYNPELTSSEETNIYHQRFDEINPGTVRIAVLTTWWENSEGTQTWNNSYMNALYKVLDLCQANGTEVDITSWWEYPSWLGGYTSKISDNSKFAHTTVDMLDYLINPEFRIKLA